MKLIKTVIPERLKERVKDRIKSNLNLVPARTLDISNRISKVGIPNYLSFSYGDLKKSALSYSRSLKVGEFQYKYAHSRTQPVLYASVYACMLEGMFGELENYEQETKRKWADYFDSFQSEDGYFRDPALAGEEFEGDVEWGDGWGIRHLAGHIIIAYARLGHTPKYSFKFLEPFYEVNYISRWLQGLFSTKDMWSASNYVMNIVTLLQYSRDYMQDSKAEASVRYILKWLEDRQNSESGLWHNSLPSTQKELNSAIRGAYHYFPLFIYEKQEVKFQDKIVDSILKTQNSWGGFEENLSAAGACEDIDAIDPLIRFSFNSGYRKDEVSLAMKRAMIHVLSNRNLDGGFSFMAETPHEYGGHVLTSSLKGESNLMATWFRILCLAYMVQYLEIENNFDIRTFPGYEISL